MTNESPMTNNKNKYDIQERTLEFAARVAKFVNKLPKNLIIMKYAGQLVEASSSIGANIEESDGTLSKKDFTHKIGISRREARESRYWLRLIKKAELVSDEKLKIENDWLINEAREIMLILSSIINRIQMNVN